MLRLNYGNSLTKMQHQSTHVISNYCYQTYGSFQLCRLEAMPNLFTIQSNENDTKDNCFDEHCRHVAKYIVSSWTTQAEIRRFLLKVQAGKTWLYIDI